MIGARWAFYTAVLHQHHHTEDTSVFPALLSVRPDLKTLVLNLEKGHRQLINALDAAEAAITDF
jgi:hypothetical protein